MNKILKNGVQFVIRKGHSALPVITKYGKYIGTGAAMALSLILADRFGLSSVIFQDPGTPQKNRDGATIIYNPNDPDEMAIAAIHDSAIHQSMDSQRVGAARRITDIVKANPTARIKAYGAATLGHLARSVSLNSSTSTIQGFIRDISMLESPEEHPEKKEEDVADD